MEKFDQKHNTEIKLEPVSEATIEKRDEERRQKNVRERYGTTSEDFTIEARTINPEDVFQNRQPTENKAGMQTEKSFDAYFRPAIKSGEVALQPMSVSVSVFPEFKKMKREDVLEELKKLNKAKPFTLDQFAALLSDQLEIEGEEGKKKDLKVREPLSVGNNTLLVIDKNNSVSLVSAVDIFGIWRLGNVKGYPDDGGWGDWISESRFLSINT